MLASNNPPHANACKAWQKETMDTVPVLIAGGGIAGLAAALAMARHGEILLLEREAAFSARGAGLQLGPNAVRALQALGAWEAVAPITFSPPEIHIRDGLSGRLLKRVILGGQFESRFGAPYRVAHRADLHGVLLGLAKANPAISIKMGVPAEQADEARAGLLIAADGVGSRIRQDLFPGSKAIDSGWLFRRALIAMPVVAGVDLSCVNLWLCPGHHVVHYPVGALGRLNIVHVVPADGALRTSVHDGLGSLLQQVTDWTDWPGRYAPALPAWRKGKTVLIGDAAHGTLPFLAQGAAMALEDAAALQHGVPHLLARQARVQRLHRATVSAGHSYHLTGLPAAFRNIALSLMPEPLFLSRLAWIYDHTS